MFVNKYQTYLYYSPFFKREVVPIMRESDNFTEFESFIKRHSKFIYKPLSGSCGRGVRLIDTGAYPSMQDLYISLRAEDGVVEELIIQDERLSRFHPSSVNTVRMPTVITKKGEVVILSAVFRVGQRNRIVDNGGAGGILANIDPVTGIVYTNGADEFGNTYVKHPQTGVVFRGFQIPRWDEAVSLAKDLASLNPRVRYVGWDLALRADGWVLVEANNSGEFKVLQIADRRGLREEPERLM